MDFSESYKASLPPVYSPDGRFLAIAVEYRLIIREADSLRIVQLYSCLDRINSLSWSPNSLYICCALYSRSLLQIWAVDQPEWSCRIDEGPAGISRVMWAPNGLSVVVLAHFQIRLTVWSLVDRRCTYLRGPKHEDKGWAFGGGRLAVLERYDCRDHLTLYDADTWQQLAHVPCDTSDACDLAWSPDGNYLAVWDSPLSYKVQVFSGEGRPQGSYEAYNDALLGVRGCSWNASGQLLAVGSYDEVCRVLNHVTWQPLLEAAHTPKVETPAHVVVYQEVAEDAPAPLSAPNTPLRSPKGGSSGLEGRSRYAIMDLPAAVPTSKPDFSSPEPKLGIGAQRWSGDSQFLATTSDSQAASVWVWDMSTMDLCAVLTHAAPISDMQWAPQGAMLAILTRNGRVYLWTPAGSSVVHIPLRGFRAHTLHWSPKGDSFSLLDSTGDAFCCAYMAAAPGVAGQ